MGSSSILVIHLGISIVPHKSANLLFPFSYNYRPSISQNQKMRKRKKGKNASKE